MSDEIIQFNLTITRSNPVSLNRDSIRVIALDLSRSIAITLTVDRLKQYSVEL